MLAPAVTLLSLQDTFDMALDSVQHMYICTSATDSTQEAQLSPSDRAMRLVSSNLANCHATVQKLHIRQVLTKLMV